MRVGEWDVFKRERFARLMLAKEAFEERTTPAAAGSGAEAFAQLARFARLMDADVVDHFATRDVEAEAKFVIWFHSFTRSVMDGGGDWSCMGAGSEIRQAFRIP